MDEMKLTDWYRIFIGEAPAEFLIEVLVRTVLIYLFLIVILRLMGKRMNGQLTIAEMAVMITLGAIVSAPMQIPDRGITQGMVILVCALLFQRGLNLWGFKNSKVENIVQGTESLLVKDGVIITDELKKAKISKQQLYSTLRNANIYNLGEVERVYLEACGLFSIFKFDNPKPGLSLAPPNDTNFKTAEYSSTYCCKNCGCITENSQIKNECTNCNANNWTKAIL